MLEQTVKLQTFNPSEHYLPNTKSFKAFEKNMFNFEQIESIFNYAKKKI